MSDNLSQEDIDRLLAGMSDETGGGGEGPSGGGLDPQEKDTLGEICNMAMAASASALSEILNNHVEIVNQGVLDFENIAEVFSTQENSTIFQISYAGGLSFTSLLILKNSDVAVIADIMMGGSGAVDSSEVGDIQLSAIGEAINQMMGTNAANLSSIFEKDITASPSNIQPLAPGVESVLPADIKTTPVTGIVYKFTVGNVIDSEFIQLIPLEVSKTKVQLFLGSVDSLLQGGGGQSDILASVGAGGFDPNRLFGATPEGQQTQTSGFSGMSQDPITIQPAKFAPLDNTRSMFGAENQNLELVLDVGLKLTVELGRAELPIKKVLELTRGSVIELDKIAGEPVDLLANGKLIAKGEVVVIEDNFGLRITSIISPADRLKNL